MRSSHRWCSIFRRSDRSRPGCGGGCVYVCVCVSAGVRFQPCRTCLRASASVYPSRHEFPSGAQLAGSAMAPKQKKVQRPKRDPAGTSPARELPGPGDDDDDDGPLVPAKKQKSEQKPLVGENKGPLQKSASSSQAGCPEAIEAGHEARPFALPPWRGERRPSWQAAIASRPRGAGGGGAVRQAGARHHHGLLPWHREGRFGRPRVFCSGCPGEASADECGSGVFEGPSLVKQRNRFGLPRLVFLTKTSD